MQRELAASGGVAKSVDRLPAQMPMKGGILKRKSDGDGPTFRKPDRPKRSLLGLDRNRKPSASNNRMSFDLSKDEDKQIEVVDEDQPRAKKSKTSKKKKKQKHTKQGSRTQRTGRTNRKGRKSKNTETQKRKEEQQQKGRKEARAKGEAEGEGKAGRARQAQADKASTTGHGAAKNNISKPRVVFVKYAFKHNY